MSHQREGKKLFFREWITICAVCGAILGLCVFSWLKTGRIERKFYGHVAAEKQENLIEVTFSGAVREAGVVYQFPPGISLKQALKQVHLTSKADRRKLNPRRILLSSQTIEIPERDSKHHTASKRTSEPTMAAKEN